MPKKINHDYTCDICNKKAKWNIQQTYHKYSISSSGDFQETDTWEGDINEFYCDDCEAIS